MAISIHPGNPALANPSFDSFTTKLARLLAQRPAASAQPLKTERKPARNKAFGTINSLTLTPAVSYECDGWLQWTTR